MVRILFLFVFFLVLSSCTINEHGYWRNPFKSNDVLWEHPVNVDSDEEQVIELPYVKYGKRISLCHDRKPRRYWYEGAECIGDSTLYNDEIEVSLSLGDTVIVGEKTTFQMFSEYGCPINGQVLLYFNVPEGFDREQGGTIHFKVLRRDYLKNLPNPRIVLTYAAPFK